MSDSFHFARTIAVDLAADVNSRHSVGSGLPANLALTSDIEQIEQITDGQKNILIYFWDPTSGLKYRIQATPFEELPDFLQEMSIDEVPEFMQRDHGLLLNQLFLELQPMVDTFLKLSRSRHFQFRLGRLQEAMCPLFHVDHVSLRMIVTLRGPGTEWLANNSVRRSGLGKGSNRKVVLPDAIVHQLKTYQIGFLKGEKFPGAFGKGVIHRSPAVPHSAEGRWFFRLDGRF